MWSEVIPEPGQYWVKLKRTGEVFTADVEDDWVLVGDYMTSHSEYLYGPKVLTAEPWTPVLNQIHEERAKQIAKGWTKEHDKGHTNFELSKTAVAILNGEINMCGNYSDVKHRLRVAAALLVAELERLDDTAAN